MMIFNSTKDRGITRRLILKQKKTSLTAFHGICDGSFFNIITLRVIHTNIVNFYKSLKF